MAENIIAAKIAEMMNKTKNPTTVFNKIPQSCGCGQKLHLQQEVGLYAC